MRRLLPMFLLVACERAPDCDLDTPYVFACLVPAGAAPGDVTLEEIADLTVEGAVVAAGRGAPPEGCLDFHRWGEDLDPGEAQTSWATLETDDGLGYTLSITAGSAVDFGAFDRLEARFTQQPENGFNGEFGDTRLEVASAGALVAWVQDTTSLSLLTPPEGVTAARAEEVCRQEEECGEQVVYDVDLAVEDGSATLEPGEVKEVGGFMVSFTGERTLEEPTCSEQMPGEVGVAVVLAE